MHDDKQAESPGISSKTSTAELRIIKIPGAHVHCRSRWIKHKLMRLFVSLRLNGSTRRRCFHLALLQNFFSTGLAMLCFGCSGCWLISCNKLILSGISLRRALLKDSETRKASLSDDNEWVVSPSRWQPHTCGGERDGLMIPSTALNASLDKFLSR